MSGPDEYMVFEVTRTKAGTAGDGRALGRIASEQSAPYWISLLAEMIAREVALMFGENLERI